ncbi:hypothetical protein [Galactobacter sp.]|uniref:hypothetical protein n=1 Tax=Galactobacter sp. TaxID=2676125 RepID=UPI0025BCA635|nr:hypothetical protein [Galactobacter sp.]
MTTHAEIISPTASDKVAQYHRDLEALHLSLSDADVSPDLSEEAVAGVVATESLWATIDRRFGLLSSAQAARAAGARGTKSTLATDRRRAGKLMGIRRNNALFFPGFQFSDGAVVPAAERVAMAARELRVPESDALAWFMLPTRQLDSDAAPVDALKDPDAVELAFRNHFGVQW